MNGETQSGVSQNTNVANGVVQATPIANPGAVVNVPEVPTNQTSKQTTIDSAAGEHNGRNVCPNCGSTEIVQSKTTGLLVCQYCRHQFEPVKAEGFENDISNLSGTLVGSGASDIIASENDMLTLKCSSCGAEVVIDTSSQTSARCHWCRNTLTIQEKVPNGAVPDVVLPFSITKDDAKKQIETFVKKRKFFANPTFKKEFTTENIMGVYFPYMLVDANVHSKLIGVGEHQTRKYNVGSNDHPDMRYDADAYNVSREFDLAVEGLSIESSKDRLNNASEEKTNNVINAIMPFDTENSVKWSANYLKGYTSEKRDANVGDLSSLVETQIKDVARFAANDTLKQYDRGVAWSTETLDMKGSQWKAAYLPVWLYSYMQVKGGKKLLHYVAVNARTKETMGSVPINMPKLVIISIIFELICGALMIAIGEDWSWIFLLGGFIFFFLMYARYRNSNARHTYETETKRTMSNLVQGDTFIENRKKLKDAHVAGCNNTSVRGSTNSDKFIDKINGKQVANVLVEGLTSGNAVAALIKEKEKQKDEEKTQK